MTQSVNNPLLYIEHVLEFTLTLFIFITMLCGIDITLRNIPHIQSKGWFTP